MSIQILSLLTLHYFCNAVAETTPLTWEEANLCVANFEELKVLLNPEIAMPEFEGLATPDRAKVSVESYRYYREWVAGNPALVEQLKAEARIIARVAGN